MKEIRHLAEPIADEMGIELCGHCCMPRWVHAGYDHGKNRCLLSQSTAMMMQPISRAEIKRRCSLLEEFYERVGAAEEAELSAAEGI